MGWTHAFFAEIECGEKIAPAAKAAGVTRQTIYYHIWNTPWFRDRLRLAKTHFTLSSQLQRPSR